MEEKEMVEAIFFSRKHRHSDPKGHFDNGKKWYPSKEEKCLCCEDIRSPSYNYPYSLLVHCRTKKHIENLVKTRGIEDSDLIYEATILTRLLLRKCPNSIAYKKVAVVNGELVSIFDGSPWKLGIERREYPLDRHRRGLYVYPNPEKAIWASFPDASKFSNHDTFAILECRIEGVVIFYDRDKIACESVTPIKIYTEIQMGE